MTNALVSIQVGVVGVKPSLFLLNSSETFAEITAAGYINPIALNSGQPIEPGDFIFAVYDNGAEQSIFMPSFAPNGAITLIPISGTGALSGLANLGAGAPVFNNIVNGIAKLRSIVGTGGIVATSDGTQIYIDGSRDSNITWNAVSSTPVTIAPNSGYVTLFGSNQVVFSLPTTAAFGDYYRIVTASIGGWILDQGASQQIVFGNVSTTLGNTGYLESALIGDTVELLCIIANTHWQVIGVTGNLVFH